MNRDLSQDISRRRFLGAAGVAVAGLSLPGLTASVRAAEAPLFPQLAKVASRFTFALIADTHIAAAKEKGGNRVTTEQRFRQTVTEINAMDPAPAFVAHVGDIVANPADANFANFKTVAKGLKPLTILTHGNHDGREPWEGFRDAQKAVNGTDGVMFSYDCGGWHFVTFPCNFQPGGEFEHKLITWLKADLAANRQKPTIVFEHFHLLPQGLTQLESYTYEKSLRIELIHILADAGNVRYVVCGHVHNGIQACLKTAWTWRGMNFITAPTCVPSRNFGEEFAPFQKGQPNGDDTGGGYYLLFDIDGDKCRVRGRLNGAKDEFAFPDTFRPYENQEPLWFKDATDYPASPQLTNGSYETGLTGWTSPYRYIADKDPGFVARSSPERACEGGQAAYLFVREKGQPWAKDELSEIYQMVKAPARGALFAANYFIDAQDVLGGGYIRLCAFAGTQAKVHALLDWGHGDRGDNLRMGAHTTFSTSADHGTAPDLVRLGKAKKALFWRLSGEPKKWHDLKVDLAAAYDQAIGQRGAYAKLGITQLQIALGVWCAANVGSRSGSWFDKLALTDATGASPAVALNGAALPIDAKVFQTEFGSGGSGGEPDAGAEPKRKERKKAKGE